MKLFALVFSFFSVLVLSSSMSLTRTAATIGSEAPDFTIFNKETTVRQADLKGGYVTVNFWSVADAVSRERNARLSRQSKEEGKEYIGICIDSDRELAAEIIAQDGLESASQYMISDIRKGDPVKYYEVESGLRAFEIDPYGNIQNIL